VNEEKIITTASSMPVHSGSENCLAVGTRLNDFEITGVLGEGGFGIVYLAFDHSLQRTVAIKEYMPGTLAGRTADGSVTVRAERHKATFDAGLKSFINEARLLAQFDHPSLVKVYRFWEKNQTAYMAMRHYHGDTLKDIVKNRPELITEAWLKFIFKQILEALDTLYKAKILHRDVSPDNIIVQKNGDAVLLDFGSARQIIGDMTQGLTVILKPGYAPVEQYSDDDDMQQGPWTDIYALAAVMYYAILKTPPPMAVARIVKDALLPLHQGNYPGFSAKFLMALDQGLAIQPKDRPQSMDEFRRLLGISAFVSARNSRSAGALHSAEILSEAEEVAKLAHIKNAPYTASVFSTRHEQNENPEQAKFTIKTLDRRVVMASSLTLFFLLVVGAYFAMRGSDIQTTAPTISTTLKQVKPDMPSKINLEQSDWDNLNNDKNSSATLEKLIAFLQKYPNGQFADAAQARISQLDKARPQGTPLKNEKQGKQGPKFNIKLMIKPWGTVFVDGVQMGASPPLKNLNLTEGKHKIRVTNPGFPDFVSEVNVNKTYAPTIAHEFTSK
jgi:serine/threonine protein kinase